MQHNPNSPVDPLTGKIKTEIVDELKKSRPKEPWLLKAMQGIYTLKKWLGLKPAPSFLIYIACNDKRLVSVSARPIPGGDQTGNYTPEMRAVDECAYGLLGTAMRGAQNTGDGVFVTPLNAHLKPEDEGNQGGGGTDKSKLH